MIATRLCCTANDGLDCCICCVVLEWMQCIDTNLALKKHPSFWRISVANIGYIPLCSVYVALVAAVASASSTLVGWKTVVDTCCFSTCWCWRFFFCFFNHQTKAVTLFTHKLRFQLLFTCSLVIAVIPRSQKLPGRFVTFALLHVPMTPYRLCTNISSEYARICTSFAWSA